MNAGPASVQEFLDFLRASGIAEEQLGPFQRVAEQLLLVCGTADLMAVSPEQTMQWREALRARNPTEAQLALIARGISAIHAFQRRRNAPPAPATPTGPSGHAAVSSDSPRPPLPQAAQRAPSPSPASSRPRTPAAPPKAGMTGPQKVIAIGFLAAVAASSVIYTVIASRAAIQESRGDGEILADRNAKRKIGIFFPAYTFSRQPAVACDPAVIQQVNDAVDASADNPRKALDILDAALHKDPHCVPAARVLTTLTAQTGGALAVLKLKSRLIDPAERDPHDASAQLIASYYARQLGDAEGYRKYLDRTEAADPNQPLLDDAWASYWDLFAKPRDFQKELFATREEIERTGDLGMLSNLAAIYFEVGDYDRAAQVCARYGASIPVERWGGLLNTCLKAVIAIGDKPAEDKYAKRFLDVNRECGHVDLGLYLLDYTCRTDDAMREANLALDRGCGEAANSVRRSGLLALHRFDEAAEPPLGGKYWTGNHSENLLHPEMVGADRNNRALALAMTGREQEARAVLEPIRATNLRAQILWGMLDQGVLKDRVEAAVGCGLSTEKSERLAGTAGGYVQWQLFEDAKPLLDQAFLLNPKSPRAWASKVYLASVAGNLKEAQALGEQALAMGVDDPYLAGNLGYVYQQLGNCEKAIPLFQRKLVGQPWTAPNYTNLAKCYDAVGRDKDAAAMWGYVLGGKPRTFWWAYVLLVAAAVGLYLGGKFALIKLAPRRFGHLRFP